MKVLSIAIWIFVLYVIQTVFCPIIGITNIVPELLFCFAVSYAVFEHRFNRLSVVVIMCALISATGVGRSFPIVMLMAGVGGIVSYLSPSYMRFIPQILRTQAVTAFFAFLMCIAENFVFSGRLLLFNALWHTVYTTIVSCVMYLILKAVMLKKKEKKLLIAQERN